MVVGGDWETAERTYIFLQIESEIVCWWGVEVEGDGEGLKWLWQAWEMELTWLQGEGEGPAGAEDCEFGAGPTTKIE